MRDTRGRTWGTDSRDTRGRVARAVVLALVEVGPPEELVDGVILRLDPLAREGRARLVCVGVSRRKGACSAQDGGENARVDEHCY